MTVSAQNASFVVRLLTALDAPPPAATRTHFGDTASNPHAAAIDALAQAGLASGDDAGRYGPNESVTRAQIATMLVAAYEYATGEPLPAGDRVFTDVDRNPHRDNIEAAAAAGITSGVGGGRYDPSGHVRRDQMTTLLVGLYERVSGSA